jgi:ABC-type multidrug transport system fused ATPase/permease subunit
VLCTDKLIFIFLVNLLTAAISCCSCLIIFLSLVDDPLSAIDAHVGDEIFHTGIRSTLQGKTVILITHQVHFIHDCDWVIIMREGEIYAQGTPGDLLDAGIDFNDIVFTEEETATVLTDLANTVIDKPRERANSQERIESQLGNDAEETAEPFEQGKLMTLEERAGGHVPPDMYHWYMRQGGLGLFTLAVIASLAGAGTAAYSSFYLSRWGRIADEQQHSGDPLSTQENLKYVSRYALYSTMGIVGVIVRNILFVLIGIQASRRLHRMLLSGVVHSTLTHFDTTPMGRILNRFTSDLTVTDDSLSTNLAFLLAMFSTLLGTIGSIAYTTNGAILILFCPLIVCYYFVQLYFRRSSIELRRLESVTRSPIYGEFNQALVGVKSLRSYRLEKIFIQRMERFVDINSGIWRIQQLLKWWLMIRLETMGGAIACFIAAIAAANTHLIADQYVSLSLQSALSLVVTVKYLMTIGSEVEAMMSSVERIRHYSENIAREESPDIIGMYTNEISPQWPEHGRISFKDVRMSYHGGPLVLKGVSFDIQSCEKIGIAGRTGCGKSSLMVAMYRFENLQDGQIEIDGVDISTVPLRTLRSRIGIIPQDPVIFSVTVRFNLDPLSLHSDQEIWSVLESVCMKDSILSLPHGLQEPVSEGGDSFSVGQKQLICIARLLLRKPKILIMDESTSSIDNETDGMIQKMIRNKFSDCTTLTIAHRLHTVIDSDRILVMDSGYAQQFAPPAELTQNEGIFANLWRKHVLSRSGRKLNHSMSM